MVERLRLSPETAPVHLSWPSAGPGGYAPRRYRDYRGNRAQFARAKRQAPSVAKRGVGMRGRSIFVMLLGAFIIVSLTIVWRRSYGIAESRRLQLLDRKRADLEGQRARLESDITDLSSRQRLGPVVEQRLGMHVPTDRQVVILSRAGQHDST